jgi:NADH-quinone oxidoreductase subunit I
MTGYLRGGLLAMATTLRNAFRRPITVEFPDVIRPRAERYRSSFALLHEADGDEACIGCLQCERICPSEVISIKVGGKRASPVTGKKRGYADDFVLDLNGCIYCELCVQVCPTDAIVMTRQPEVPAYGREDLVLTMAKLYANEKSKARAWGDATRLNAMQTPPKAPVVAASPRPAPPPAAAAAALPVAAAAKVASAPTATAAAAPSEATATAPTVAPAPTATAAAVPSEAAAKAPEVAPGLMATAATAPTVAAGPVRTTAELAPTVAATPIPTEPAPPGSTVAATPVPSEPASPAVGAPVPPSASAAESTTAPEPIPAPRSHGSGEGT